MWMWLIWGFVILILCSLFCDDDKDVPHIPISSDANTLFSIANRLEYLYGGRVFVGLQIPDPDTATPQNIDLVHVTKEAVVVILAKINEAFRFIGVDEDGTWFCTGLDKHLILRINPVAEAKRQVSILQSYLERRGIDLPKGYFSCKVICPDPEFCTTRPIYFPPEVITYKQWVKLKPETEGTLSGWIRGAILGGKKEMQESKLIVVLSTAPMWDRLELKGNKHILGLFLEFIGNEDDTQALRNIKRAKVGRLIIQKTSMFSSDHSELRILYSPRDYRGDRASASQWKEMTVRSSTMVLFQPRNFYMDRFKLSSISSMTLSA